MQAFCYGHGYMLPRLSSNWLGITIEANAKSEVDQLTREVELLEEKAISFGTMSGIKADLKRLFQENNRLLSEGKGAGKWGPKTATTITGAKTAFGQKKKENNRGIDNT